MDLQRRVDLLEKVGEFIVSEDQKWRKEQEKAFYENPWFTPEFISYQLRHIAAEYLGREKLSEWIEAYKIPREQSSPKRVGVVMAGNIPLAGFHDFLACFISGHHQTIKPSSKDRALISAIVKKIIEWDPRAEDYISFADQLKGCYAYIATGSNNSSRYFDYYFSKYPHIIRRNRTSAAILTDNETVEELSALADDVYLYFGLGCRNVTKIFVPVNYDFFPLLEAFRKYDNLADHHKYKNNYDYQLAVLMINKIYYMTNGSILLQENPSLFSPISQLHYEYYSNPRLVLDKLQGNPDIQCIVGKGYVPFGQAQHPQLGDYADKADTLQFLRDL